MKGIVLYDRREDTFTVAEHNVDDAAVGALLSRYRSEGLPAFEFPHPRRHRTEPADSCRLRPDRAGRDKKQGWDRLTSDTIPVGSVRGWAGAAVVPSGGPPPLFPRPAPLLRKENTQ